MVVLSLPNLDCVLLEDVKRGLLKTARHYRWTVDESVVSVGGSVAVGWTNLEQVSALDLEVSVLDLNCDLAEHRLYL